MAEIFKAYDIRGIYGTDLTEEIAYKIGRAFATFLDCKKVVIGYDMRESSKSLFESLSKGLVDQGVDVINIGLCSTPMSYYANGKLGVDGSIMLTASHNPGEYNGFKLCKAGAVPISGSTGIKEIKELVEKNEFEEVESKGKIIINEEIKNEYVDHISSFFKIDKKYDVVIDCANSMGIKEFQEFLYVS